MIRFQKPSPPLSLSLSSLAQVFLPYVLLETLGILHVYLTLHSHQLTCALNVPPSSLNQQACTVGLQKADDILSPLFLQDPERYKAASPKIYRLAALEALCLPSWVALLALAPSCSADRSFQTWGCSDHSALS